MSTGRSLSPGNGESRSNMLCVCVCVRVKLLWNIENASKNLNSIIETYSGNAVHFNEYSLNIAIDFRVAGFLLYTLFSTLHHLLSNQLLSKNCKAFSVHGGLWEHPIGGRESNQSTKQSLRPQKPCYYEIYKSRIKKLPAILKAENLFIYIP